MKYFIGLDVGKNGGVVVIQGGKIVEMHTIPTIGKKYDLVALANIIKKYAKLESFFCIEDVRTIVVGSKSSNFMFGEGKGILEGMVAMSECPYELVMPKTWQKMVWTPNDIVKKNPKATSLLASKRLFPNETFLASSRSKKPHDGLVDAALISYYAYLKHK